MPLAVVESLPVPPPATELPPAIPLLPVVPAPISPVVMVVACVMEETPELPLELELIVADAFNDAFVATVCASVGLTGPESC